jgi:hypothetical protein
VLLQLPAELRHVLLLLFIAVLARSGSTSSIS